MSEHYQTVKDYFTRGLWSAGRVQDAVGRWITQAEANAILSGTENP